MADHTPEELKEKFWSQLADDMTAMLGLPGHCAPRPMTAQLRGDKDRGPIWFFTSKETDLAQALNGPTQASMTFVAKDHDLFATVEGTLTADNDPEVIDDLWNRFVAAWFEGGKEDPKLQLLRFDPAGAEIWLDASSLVAGIKMLLGAGDPKEDYGDNVAKVRLG
jgi:general stress protein 26